MLNNKQQKTLDRLLRKDLKLRESEVLGLCEAMGANVERARGSGVKVRFGSVTWSLHTKQGKPLDAGSLRILRGIINQVN